MVKRSQDPLLSLLARFQFMYVAAFAIFTIIFDGGNVITRERIYQRWMLTAVMLVVFAVFWVVIKKTTSRTITLLALFSCVITELVAASLMTYWERGMASTSTIMYLIPVITMAFSRSRSFTVGTAVSALALYTAAATKYFYDYFNEGYRVQLYGEIFFYGAVCIIGGWLVASLAHALKK